MSGQKYSVTYVCSSCDHRDEVEYDTLDSALDAVWPACKACGEAGQTALPGSAKVLSCSRMGR